MSPINAGRLLLLAALFGASFLFMRIGVPSLGPIALIGARVGFAALFLSLVAWFLHREFALQHWRSYLFLGLTNTGLPFLAYGFAAQSLNASTMSILNATAPIWGTFIAAILARQFPSSKTIIGLILGVLGVAILVGFDQDMTGAATLWSVAACLFATFCYGLSASYTKLKASHIPSFQLAHGSMYGATAFIFIPLLMNTHAIQVPSLTVALAVLALAVFCTGCAYLLLFRLMSEIGAASTLTVTFLVPVFGILWGALFLNEHIGRHTLLGAVVVLLGTALVTNFNPQRLWRRA